MVNLKKLNGLNSPTNIAAGKFVKVGTMAYLTGNYNGWRAIRN